MNKKLYVVKNDEGKYWDTGMPPWWDDKTGSIFKRIDLALRWAKKYDGHVVTLIEEPEKVVLTKEQAEIIEEAHNDKLPACYISSKSDDEELLMNAYVNGYNVAKEKKYNVKVPHTEDFWYYKWNGNLMTICQLDKRFQVTFTEADIEHYDLQDCEKEEVANDDQ